MSPDDKTLIALGLVVKPRGLKGEVIVRPFDENNPNLRRGLPVIIETKKESLSTKASHIAKTGNRLVVKFEGVDSREQAEALAGGEISTQLKNLAAKGEKEFYVFELIGLEVIDADNQIFGKIKDVLNMPANDILLVESPHGEILVPFVGKVVDSIDLVKKQVRIERIREFLP